MTQQEDFLRRAEAMAKGFVWDFYQKRKSIWQIMEQMDEKCFSWIGVGPGEYLRSYDEALHYFAEQRYAGAVPLIEISEEHYDAQLVTNQVCIVLCEYLLTVRPETGNVMQERQRSTITIRRAHGGKLLACQIHASNPWYPMKGDERWPEQFGRQTYTYFLELLSELELKEMPHLSSQQRKVLVLMMHGKTYQDIAAALDITYRTVQYHVRMIFNKFGVDCREMLFAKLIRTLCATMGNSLDHDGDDSNGDDDMESKVLKALDDAAKKYKISQRSHHGRKKIDKSNLPVTNDIIPKDKER
ncbi:helix-turn-helix transcriptional regulator [Mitsuokella multacida]|uniref:helix-turn-helix transcriptional regulator n=1 Tax=Mitsuokella multacida TaxID=52226 RepID=UPI001F427599|nr:helix-turn-helix transcriptional regulator [Mitsuokella multacida]MCF2584607.1 nuclear transport factor 2 family protein [Mitsuokella multacida]